MVQRKHFPTFMCKTTYLGTGAGGRNRANALRDSFNKVVIYTYNLSTLSLFF